MAEIHLPPDELQEEHDVFTLLLDESESLEGPVIRAREPYRCKCGKAHSPAKSPCRFPPMDPETKEAQRREVIDFKNLLTPVREILQEYNLVVSWRDPYIFVEDTVRIALFTPSHARAILRLPITRIKELLEDIDLPLKVVSDFCDKHDHLVTRWNRVHFQVVAMNKTVELLEDVFAHDYFISMLRRERGLGLCGWSVLLCEGISRSMYKFQHQNEGIDQ
ncbi:hypothetical protein BDZ89DRAFT_1050864 [Hymenopellis radicata]|nr:hypothetical protein BDZ89DRAFT_1050864 [Hymenopellis radicata]